MLKGRCIPDLYDLHARVQIRSPFHFQDLLGQMYPRSVRSAWSKSDTRLITQVFQATMCMFRSDTYPISFAIFSRGQMYPRFVWSAWSDQIPVRSSRSCRADVSPICMVYMILVRSLCWVGRRTVCVVYWGTIAIRTKYCR